MIVKMEPFEICPAGMHIGRCTFIAYLGHQKNNFGDHTRTLIIEWEIYANSLDDMPKYFKVNKRYSLYLSKGANLRKDLMSMLGRDLTKDELSEGYDTRQLLDEYYYLNIIHNTAANGNTYANIQSVSQLPNGATTPPKSDTYAIEYSVDEDIETGFEVLKGYPDYFQQKIKDSLEYQEYENGK